MVDKIVTWLKNLLGESTNGILALVIALLAGTGVVEAVDLVSATAEGFDGGLAALSGMVVHHLYQRVPKA